MTCIEFLLSAWKILSKTQIVDTAGLSQAGSWGGRLVNPISTRGLLILHTQYYEPPPLSRIFRPCDGPAKLKHLEQKILSCNKYYILTRTMYENDHKNVLVFDIWLSLVSKIKHSTILIFLCQKVGGQIFLIFFVEEYKN